MDVVIAATCEVNMSCKNTERNIYYIFMHQRTLFYGDFMLPWGDYNLQLYFQGSFYLYLRSFYHQLSFLFPQTSYTIMCVAAFLMGIIELYFCGISVECQTKRHSCFATFTLLSQLIFSLAGILMQRGLSCNACAWQSFFRLRPDVAWLMRSTLVK